MAYLAIESSLPHRRDTLAALLWPNRPEAQARNSLRQAIYQLSSLLATGSKSQTHLIVRNDQVRFNPASDHWIDVLEYQRRLSAAQSHHPLGEDLCSSCLENLQQAVALYRGEFLVGFSLPDCNRFTDWKIITQETCHRQVLTALTLLADYFERQCAYEQLIACTQRKIELEPWRETAYRRQMWALAMSGQRQNALQLFENLGEVLDRELGIAPLAETSQLYEQIRSGKLSAQRPRTVEGGWPFSVVTQTLNQAAPPFVGRRKELDKLHRNLDDALAFHGRLVFITGETGSGKTALLNEFAWQAVATHSDLLVAGGSCCAYGGRGDSYQPFREVLEMLAGIDDAASHGPMNSTEPARRLSAALPDFLQDLFETGPGLASTLLSVRELHQHARDATGLGEATFAGLAALEAQPGSRRSTGPLPDPGVGYPKPEPDFRNTMGLFGQYTHLLRSFSRRFPLLILLDDLQWADPASASLLFHLAGYLQGARILLLGAYRPEDLVQSVQGDRHPLAAALNEFQRRDGECRVDLASSEKRIFLNAYLDREPNHFDQEFRDLLIRQTGGNALFTIELLNAMKARCDLVQDISGYWKPSLRVNWETLPARVEAVVAERLSRLDCDYVTLLEAASVQGEVFSAAVLALVLGVREDEIIARMRGTLSEPQNLVMCLDMGQPDGSQCACYRFRKSLYQKYLYHKLDRANCARLHQATEIALERLGVTQTICCLSR